VVVLASQRKAVKTASGRFKTLVKSCARSAQNRNSPFGHSGFMSYATGMSSAGRNRVGSIYDLQERLGHSGVKTAEIYLSHLTTEEQRTVKVGLEQKPEQEQHF
jgi:integrase/recombinase XerD